MKGDKDGIFGCIESVDGQRTVRTLIGWRGITDCGDI